LTWIDETIPLGLYVPGLLRCLRGSLICGRERVGQRHQHNNNNNNNPAISTITTDALLAKDGSRKKSPKIIRMSSSQDEKNRSRGRSQICIASTTIDPITLPHLTSMLSGWPLPANTCRSSNPANHNGGDNTRPALHESTVRGWRSNCVEDGIIVWSGGRGSAAVECQMVDEDSTPSSELSR